MDPAFDCSADVVIAGLDPCWPKACPPTTAAADDDVAAAACGLLAAAAGTGPLPAVPITDGAAAVGTGVLTCLDTPPTAAVGLGMGVTGDGFLAVSVAAGGTPA